jgi:hypothetical protein
MYYLVTCDNLHLFHALQEVLLVLDGTTGLNMLQQAREFNDVTMPSAFVLNSSVYFYMLVTTMDFSWIHARLLESQDSS